MTIVAVLEAVAIVMLLLVIVALREAIKFHTKRISYLLEIREEHEDLISRMNEYIQESENYIQTLKQMYSIQREISGELRDQIGLMEKLYQPIIFLPSTDPFRSLDLSKLPQGEGS